MKVKESQITSEINHNKLAHMCCASDGRPNRTGLCSDFSIVILHVHPPESETERKPNNNP